MEKWGVGADWDKSMRNSCVSPARDGEMSIQKEIDRTDRQTKVENHTFKQVEQRITKEFPIFQVDSTYCRGDLF